MATIYTPAERAELGGAALYHDMLASGELNRPLRRIASKPIDHAAMARRRAQREVSALRSDVAHHRAQLGQEQAALAANVCERTIRAVKLRMGMLETATARLAQAERAAAAMAVMA